MSPQPTTILTLSLRFDTKCEKDVKRYFAAFVASLEDCGYISAHRKPDSKEPTDAR